MAADWRRRVTRSFGSRRRGLPWFATGACVGWLVAVGVVADGGATADPADGRGPKRLRRAESFLGIHFDFHAGDDCLEIGKNTTREMIQEVLGWVKPDYVQIDCKGHPGLSSYPTKAGHPAPGFVGDPLRLWRQVTAEQGVALYMHYSGVWDGQAAQRHPDWARVDEKGQRDQRLISVFGPYADQLLIPQLRELAGDYGVDGIWVDGECWATERDYAEAVLKAFREQTGSTEAPRQRGGPHWLEFSEFCREGFRKYLRHYVEEVHRTHPEFQIASNWAFSSMMPEPVTANVDFISGDYTPQNSVNSARLEGRCLVHQGRPWDLMAWAFTGAEATFSTKTATQLMQEAAVVLSLGGGFQAYFPQRRDGSVRLWQMGVMREVAKFCRARQAYCHQAKPVPQVGLIYSGRAFYRAANKLFAAWGGELTPLQGVLQCLLDSQYVVDIVMEHHLEGKARTYPLLIYPEWETIEPELKRELLEYVREGGNLLLLGPKTAALFQDELNLQAQGAPAFRLNALEGGRHVAAVRSLFQPFAVGAGTRAWGEVRRANELTGPAETAAVIAPFGQGRLAATFLGLGEAYATSATSAGRDFLRGLVRELFPRPLVEVTGSHYVDVTVNRLGSRLLVNLVDTAGPHNNAKITVFDEVPPVGPLAVTIRCPDKPKRVRLQPGDRKANFTWGEGTLRVMVPRVEFHDILEVETAR